MPLKVWLDSHGVRKAKESVISKEMTAECSSTSSFEPSAAARVASAILRYERFRLGIYQSRKGNPDRIEMRNFGDAWAMRFPAVGYFNQVHGFTTAELPLLAAITDFFAGSAPRFTIHVDPWADHPAVVAGLREAGFEPKPATVRLAGVPQAAPPATWPAGLTVAPVESDEAEAFARLYLEGFGAAPKVWPGAIENLRLLPGQPGLHCLVARRDGRPIGLGMVHLAKGVAFLCAGAVLENWQRRGVQQALISERLRLAAAAGCELAVSWAEADGSSHRNLERAGLGVVQREVAWQSPVRDSGAPPSGHS